VGCRTAAVLVYLRCIAAACMARSCLCCRSNSI
jgi:hypothetical protein